MLVVVDVTMDLLDRVHERIAGRFTRSEPRAQAREYVSDRIAGTNNYGRRILRRWRTTGHRPPGTATAPEAASRLVPTG